MTTGGPPDERAAEFTAWYHDQWHRVWTVLAGACGDPSVAEEARAEAFAKAYARWDQVRAKASPSAWVYVVALNEVRNRVRRARLERQYLARQAETPHPPPREPHSDLWAAMRHLPPRMRTALALRYIADLSEAQVAQVLGVSPGTAASILSRGRRRLAELLDPETEGAHP